MCFISIKPPTLAQPVCGWTALAGFPLAFKESWHLVNGRGEKTRMKNNLKVPPILIRSRNRQSSLALPRPSSPQSTSALTAASLTRSSPSLHWNSPRIVFDVILPTTQASGVHFITAWNLGKKKKNNKKRRESCCLLNFSVPLTGFMLQQPLNNANRLRRSANRCNPWVLREAETFAFIQAATVALWEMDSVHESIRGAKEQDGLWLHITGINKDTLDANVAFIKKWKALRLIGGMTCSVL